MSENLSFFRALTVLLVGWGLGWLVARSLIFEPVRNVLQAVSDALAPTEDETPSEAKIARILRLPVLFVANVTHCAACSGFWIGLALGAGGDLAGVPSPFSTLATGIAVMGFNALADSWLAANVSRI